MTDTKRLRELAENVKNRDWEFVDQDGGQFVVAVVNRSKKGSAHDKIKHICGLAGFASKTEEFRFIAAANPQAIIALIDELEKTERENSRLTRGLVQIQHILRSRHLSDGEMCLAALSEATSVMIRLDEKMEGDA